MHNMKTDARHARLPRLNADTRRLLDIVRADVAAYDTLNRMLHDATRPNARGGVDLDLDLFLTDFVPYVLDTYLSPADALGQLAAFDRAAAIAAQRRIQWPRLAEHVRFYVRHPLRDAYQRLGDGWVVAVYRDLGLAPA